MIIMVSDKIRDLDVVTPFVSETKRLYFCRCDGTSPFTTLHLSLPFTTRSTLL